MKPKYLTIFFILLIGGHSFAQKFDFDGMRYRGEIKKEYSLSENGSLIMKNIHGDVEIVGEARNDILITEKFSINAYSESAAEKIYRSQRAKYILKGKTLLIEGSGSSRRYQSDFIVQVPSKFNLDINTSGGDIVAETINGAVELHTSGGDIDVVEITGKLDLHTSGGDINICKSRKDITAVTSGGDISLNKIIGRLYAKTSGGDITIEDMEGDGEVRTSGGDIYVSRIKGNRFDASTSGGDIGADYINTNIKLSTSGGDINIGISKHDVRLHTSGGDIDINEVGGNLNAGTSGGDIYVKTVIGFCDLHTSGGDIEIETARSKVKTTASGGDIILSSVYGAVYAKTSGGDIELQKVIDKSIKDHSINMKSSGGDIRLYIPDNIEADVFAQIIVYNKWDNNQIRSDFPLNINKERRGSKLIITGEGQINGGGDDVTLKTSGGDIKINRVLQ